VSSPILAKDRSDSPPNQQLAASANPTRSVWIRWRKLK
jgi:hypothetical protein